MSEVLQLVMIVCHVSTSGSSDYLFLLVSTAVLFKMKYHTKESLFF